MALFVQSCIKNVLRDRYWIYRWKNNCHFFLSTYLSSIYLYLYVFDPLFSIYTLIISVFTISIHMYIYEHKARAVESQIGYVNTEGYLVTAGNLIPGKVLLESKLLLLLSHFSRVRLCVTP